MHNKKISQLMEKILGPSKTRIPGLVIGVIANVITLILGSLVKPEYQPLSIIWPILILLAVLGLGFLLFYTLVGFWGLFLRSMYLFILTGSVALMGFECERSFVRVPELRLLESSTAVDKLRDADLISSFKAINNSWDGVVVKQDSRAGRFVLKGEVIELTLDEVTFSIKTADEQLVVSPVAIIKGSSYPLKKISDKILYILVRDREEISFRITGPLQVVSDTAWEVPVHIGEMDDTGREFEITAILSICDYGESYLTDEVINKFDPCGNTKFSNTLLVKRR
jgi:hypothetical protein